MSFFGNILGGYGASQLSKYNAGVIELQAKIDAKKQKLEKRFIKILNDQI